MERCPFTWTIKYRNQTIQCRRRKRYKILSLHKECLTPIKYKKFAPDCTDEEIDDKDIVKAYEYAPHKYIIMDEKELAELQKLTNQDLFVLYLLSKITKLILFSTIVLIL